MVSKCQDDFLHSVPDEEQINNAWILGIKFFRMNYHEDISFEVGGYDDTAEKELIITALGNKKIFQPVFQLVESAPAIENWKFTALKPPVNPEDRLTASFWRHLTMKQRLVSYASKKTTVSPPKFTSSEFGNPITVKEPAGNFFSKPRTIYGTVTTGI